MKICIIYPNPEVCSQTFIWAHLERLPAQIMTWNWIPKYDRPLKKIFARPQNSKDLWLNFELSVDSLKRAALGMFLIKNRPDAVLAEYGPSGAMVTGLCEKNNIPLIVYFFGNDAYKHAILEEFGEAYQRIFQIAKAIVAVSHDMEQRLADLGAPKDKIFYNPCGADLSLFLGGNPGRARPVFVATGNFVDKKAPHLTLLSFKKVVDEFPEARLIMIGDGPLWEACKQLASALGILKAVDFQGPLSHKNLASTMREARAFVQHSIRTSDGDSEGTPVVILEAGATGLPVVATRHAGIKDVVIDGKTGFLVEEGDVEAMARQMIKLAKDPNLAADMGKRARERIASEFSMDKSIARLYEIIQEAVQKSRAG